MKRLFLFLLMGLGLFSFVGCAKDELENPTESNSTTESEPQKEITYTIEVVDLNSEVLLKEEYKTKDKTSLKSNVDTNLKATYNNGMLESVMGSIIDPNYFLAIYQNGKMTETGIDGVVLNDKDEIKFVNTCWNESLDLVDQKIDSIIYSFFKNAKSHYGASADFDMYFLASAKAMVDLGYKSANLDFLGDAYFNNYSSMDMNTIKDNQMSKYALSQMIANKDLNPLKELLKTKDIKKTGSIWADAPFFTASLLLDIEVKNQNDFITFFTDYANNIGKADEGAFAAPILKTIEGFDNNKYADSQLPYFTADGINAGWGANSNSTGLQIMAFSILGLDIRNEAYLVDGLSLVDILLNKYLVDGYLFKDRIDSEAYDLAFATPQSLAGLISYKIFRDKGSCEIF